MNLGFNQNENQDDRKRTEVWNVQMRGGGQHEGIKESKTFRSNEMENLKINTEYKWKVWQKPILLDSLLPVFS